MQYGIPLSIIANVYFNVECMIFLLCGKWNRQASPGRKLSIYNDGPHDIRTFPILFRSDIGTKITPSDLLFTDERTMTTRIY